MFSSLWVPGGDEYYSDLQNNAAAALLHAMVPAVLPSHLWTIGIADVNTLEGGNHILIVLLK